MNVSVRTPHRLGIHRVLQPAGAFPQTAWKIDSTPVALANEILCDVDALNIDAASFAQIKEVCGGDPAKIGAHIEATVRERGKQHNPVTGSGGMFVGRVAAIGHALSPDVRKGDRIASLVSLTLTPLHVERVLDVDVETGRVAVQGKAILFESATWTKLPDDIDPGVALAALDVAGAPAQMHRLVTPGMSVTVIGADGKSGMLCCAQAKRQAGPNGRVVGVGPDAGSPGATLLREGGFVDEFVEGDARDPIELSSRVPEADLVVNCVNVPGTELASILLARDGGTVYFFSMATSFTAAALGAEGVGKDVTMIIGNGYTRGHAAIALDTLREHSSLLAYFHRKYAARGSI